MRRHSQYPLNFVSANILAATLQNIPVQLGGTTMKETAVALSIFHV